MQRVRLLHWDAAESIAIQQLLTNAGFLVEYDCEWNPALLKAWRQNPPDAFVIDLSRVPSRGREIAIALRQSPKTRHIPIVFCEGKPDKVDLIREQLPDATYSTCQELTRTLTVVRSSQLPGKPVAMMDRYRSRTTAQKLGVTEGATVFLINAPSNVNAVLGELPSEVQFVEEVGTITLCFINSVDQLRLSMSDLRGFASKTKLWFLWRKKGAPGHSGITDRLVRNTGVELGLVDYRVCSVDSTWSAMLFARKR